MKINLRIIGACLFMLLHSQGQSMTLDSDSEGDVARTESDSSFPKAVSKNPEEKSQKLLKQNKEELSSNCLFFKTLGFGVQVLKTTLSLPGRSLEWASHHPAEIGAAVLMGLIAWQQVSSAPLNTHNDTSLTGFYCPEVLLKAELNPTLLSQWDPVFQDFSLSDLPMLEEYCDVIRNWLDPYKGYLYARSLEKKA